VAPRHKRAQRLYLTNTVTSNEHKAAREPAKRLRAVAGMQLAMYSLHDSQRDKSERNGAQL
jgi:hypothetical protein